MALLKRAATFLQPTPRTTPDEWGAQNRRYPASAGLPGPRDPTLTGYMIPFSRQVHAAEYRRVVGVTAAQSGKTDTLLDCIGARLDQRPAPILYVGPSKDFVSDQFEPRLMDLVDDARVLRDKVVRGRRMKKTLKIIAGVRVRLGSAGSSTSLKSDPFALGIVDEYDEMVANIKGQGDPLGLVEARGETYADFVTAVTSTPSTGIADTETDPVSGLEFWKVGDTDQIESPIWRLWQSGTRHHFAWPCPHCGAFFVPMFKHLQWPENATPAKAREGAYLLCPTNGCVIENHHKPEMIAGGVQIAPGQTVDDAVAETNLPESNTWSCWTSGLCSPFVTFGERAERYLYALQSGEEDKIQTVMNAGFGELHSVAARGDVPEWKEVEARQLPYREGDVPLGGLRIVMAVDVQKFSLIYVIRAFGARGTSWLITSGQLYGPTDDDAVWTDLADLMLTPVGGMHIEKVGIDSGFRPDKPEAGSEHKVYEFCRRYAWLCVPTKGRAVQSPPYRVSKIEVKPDGRKATYSINLAILSTDFFKSLVVSRIRTPMGTPGAWYVHEGVTEDYCKQVASEARIIEKGRPKWVRKQRDNHMLDCEAICAALGYSINVQRIPVGAEREPDEPVKERPVKLPAGDAPPPEPGPPPAGDGGGMRDRWARRGRSMNNR